MTGALRRLEPPTPGRTVARHSTIFPYCGRRKGGWTESTCRSRCKDSPRSCIANPGLCCPCLHVENIVVDHERRQVRTPDIGLRDHYGVAGVTASGVEMPGRQPGATRPPRKYHEIIHRNQPLDGVYLRGSDGYHDRILGLVGLVMSIFLKLRASSSRWFGDWSSSPQNFSLLEISCATRIVACCDDVPGFPKTIREAKRPHRKSRRTPQVA